MNQSTFGLRSWSLGLLIFLFGSGQFQCADGHKKDQVKSASSWSGRRICKYAAGAVTGAVCALMFYVGVNLRAKVIWDESFEKAKENLAAQQRTQAVPSPEPQPEPPLGSGYHAAKGALDAQAMQTRWTTERALEADQATFENFGFWKKLGLVFRGLQVTGSAQERTLPSVEAARGGLEALDKQDKVLVNERRRVIDQLRAATERYIQAGGQPPVK